MTGLGAPCRSRWAVVAMTVLAMGLAACSPSLRTSPLAFGDATGVYTAGNLRLVTERNRVQPATGRVLPTLCTEPSPDYAVAVDQTASLSVILETLGQGKLDLSSTEKATALDGRSAGVLALRDGLYAACQSYVNGVIGHDAYALILSQYGDELVELMHASTTPPVPAASGADTSVSAAAPAVTEHRAVADASDALLMHAALTHTGAGAPAAASPAAQAEAVKARQAAFAALLVSCVSEHDPTRIGGEDGQSKNPMLSERYCRHFLGQAVATIK